MREVGARCKRGDDIDARIVVGIDARTGVRIEIRIDVRIPMAGSAPGSALESALESGAPGPGRANMRGQ
jgi:hypothetical protein